MRILFGGTSFSKRRNLVGWTDPRPFERVLTLAQPDEVVHGHARNGGDRTADRVAYRYFFCQGRDPRACVRRCPINHEKDGEWPYCGHVRTERMFVEECPTHAVLGIMGKIGEPYSSGSETTARLCNEGLYGVLDGGRVRRRKRPSKVLFSSGIVDVRPIPLLVFRQNGVELPQLPHPEWSRHGPLGVDLWNARFMLERLYRVSPEGSPTRKAIAPVGEAVAMALQATRQRVPTPEVCKIVAIASERTLTLLQAEPRIVPWLWLVSALLKRWV